jgi:ribosomal protein S18 acetylase RimI-like enzyme
MAWAGRRCEQAMTDHDWAARVERGAWFLAFEEDEPVGIVCSFAEPAHRGSRQLVAMWVEPAVRGSPLAGHLVEAVLALARAEGAESVFLWVADNNDRARRFYERLGFAGTGQRQPLPSNPSVGEEQMALIL